MHNTNKIILYLSILIFGIIITIISLLNIINPPVKYVEYTEEEIKQKAKELGMVELKEYIEMNQNDSVSKHEKEDEEISTNNNENDHKEQNENNLNRGTVEDNKDAEENGEYIKFIINKGEKSESITKRLYEAGLIDDIDEFTKLIVKKDVERYFSYGTFKIKKDSDYETIIKILTGK